MQLSRATLQEGLDLFQVAARSDLIMLKNVLDTDMLEAMARLEVQADETR